MAAKTPFSSLELVNRVDTWPYYQGNPEIYKNFMSSYYYFMVEGYPKPMGYMHRSIVEDLPLSSAWNLNQENRSLTLCGQDTFQGRTEAVLATLREAVDTKRPAAPRKFYDELLPIYSPKGEHVMDIDRSGLDVFGVTSYSAHMIAYTKTDAGLQYWVPKRAKMKPTVPSLLDSTVAGVVRSGEAPIDCIVRKVLKEAAVPADYTRKHALACGTASYQMTITSTGSPGCQHVVHYLYEMEFGKDMTPDPDEGEVEKFTLMSLDQVEEALMRGEFVANRAMIWISYLIRHGLVNAENERNLVEICARLHRKHDLFEV